jgi:hypothetical protein
MLMKPTFWVRSKQANEIGCFGRRPVPAKFKSLQAAKQYRSELNLRRGAYHPGYFIEQPEAAPDPSTTALGKL